mmetsp:Transcript_138224/g.359148  ORF Transcript_138224/g.359148 Transcript_138224/m.359148 type:complete len:287 (+) Transcript_138224:62-922(+)
MEASWQCDDAGLGFARRRRAANDVGDAAREAALRLHELGALLHPSSSADALTNLMRARPVVQELAVLLEALARRPLPTISPAGRRLEEWLAARRHADLGLPPEVHTWLPPNVSGCPVAFSICSSEAASESDGSADRSIAAVYEGDWSLPPGVIARACLRSVYLLVASLWRQSARRSAASVLQWIYGRAARQLEPQRHQFYKLPNEGGQLPGLVHYCMVPHRDARPIMRCPLLPQSSAQPEARVPPWRWAALVFMIAAVMVSALKRRTVYVQARLRCCAMHSALGLS